MKELWSGVDMKAVTVSSLCIYLYEHDIGYQIFGGSSLASDSFGASATIDVEAGAGAATGTGAAGWGC